MKQDNTNQTPRLRTSRTLNFESLEHRRVMDTGVGAPAACPPADDTPTLELIQTSRGDIKIDVDAMRQSKYGTSGTAPSFRINRVPPDLPSDLTLTTSKSNSWLPQGKPVSKSSRSVNSRIPIGVFPNGAVTPLHPNISPRVFDLMKQYGTGPIMPTLHRRGVFGAPTNTVAGSNPVIQELAWLQENWHYGTGVLSFHEQSIDIQLPLSSTVTVNRLYQGLTRFQHFDEGNAANVTVHSTGPLDSRAFDGQLFATFKPITELASTRATIEIAFGNFLQNVLNGNTIPVRLYLNPEIHEVMAVTLGNHVLCGARVWRVYSIPNGDIRVQTIAWEQRNGCVNNAGYAVLGQSAMKFIWRTYLENIAKNATSQGGSYSIPSTHTADIPGNRVNPLYQRAEAYRRAHQLPNQICPQVIKDKSR